MKSIEYLKIALGGNMNVATLTPLAISEIMESYAREVAIEFAEYCDSPSYWMQTHPFHEIFDEWYNQNK